MTLPFCLLAVACSTDGGQPGEEPDGPQLLSFGANTATLTEQRQSKLVLSAVLTDPEGVDDIVGGTLIDPVSSATYGTFATGAQEGAYSLELTWDAFNSVQPIDTTEAQPTTKRTVEARFFDQAGHKASRSIDVTLACAESSNGEFSVNGNCAKLLTPSGCGGDYGCSVDIGHDGILTGTQACNTARTGAVCRECVWTSPESCDTPLDAGARCFCDIPR
ncbi:MAG: hypothetical protein SFX73_30190 [Kofleriaceae bacterium]|nr:hypothetical protein [Kofleriaceae bacterium]